MTPDAALVAALFAVDPAGLGGVALRSAAGSTRDAWLALLRGLLPEATPLRRVPVNVSDVALLGGLDLGATLQAGRPIAQSGVLAQADGGIVLLAMAERLSAGTAARLAAVLDTGEVAIERDGLCLRRPARLGVLAFDEGANEDERMPAALRDRLALHLELDAAFGRDTAESWQRSDVTRASTLLPKVVASDEVLQALCAAALALGVASLRAPLLALRVARAAAALTGATTVGTDHAALAARLVLAPRATQLPATEASDQDAAPEPAEASEPGDPPDPPDHPDRAEPATSETPAPPPPSTAPQQPESQTQADEETATAGRDQALAESVLEAAQAAIPAGLLAALKIGQGQASSRAQQAGRAGAVQRSQTRGRPIGARRGEPRGGARLNVIETLRAAAPWQRLRRNAAQADAAPRRIQVRREDFHVTRFRQLGQTTTLFVVDASGSSALHRLAEAKGAVELLLADCYVRRDRVCVLAFRGQGAELLLPPTRSLARAKRSLAALPGGGGTPLAAGLDAACALAASLSRGGETTIVVLLTDGRGNIARDGTPGRARAAADALLAARQMRAARLTALWIDTSPHPQPAAAVLAREMGATYVPLPYAGAQAVSQVVRGLAGASAAAR